MDRDSSDGIATLTGWAVLGSNPGGSDVVASVYTCPGAHPVFYTLDTGSLFRWGGGGGKRPGGGNSHSPPSRSEVKERIELHLYSPSGPSRPVLG
jgi:hypothetical protein